jgi:hypothetical protein
LSGERLRYVLPGRSFSSPLGSPRVRLGRCFLPTSATDFPKRAPKDRSGSRAHGVSRADRAKLQPKPEFSRDAEPRFDGGPTSGGRTIDAVPPTSAVSTTARLARRRAEHRVSGAAWPRCCQPCFQAGDRPLTPSVAPRPAWIPRRDPAYRRASAGSAAPSSKGATSTVQSAFHRQVLPKFMLSHVLPGSCFSHDPAPSRWFRRGTRHQSRGFATTIPASDTSSPPAALALEG